jgi:hypothetical protein
LLSVILIHRPFDSTVQERQQQVCDRKCLSRHLANNGHEVLIDDAGLRAGCGVPSRHRDRSGFPIEGPMMSDKSPRKSMSKKSGKSLKEKRADKKAKSSEHTVIETAFHAKKR